MKYSYSELVTFARDANFTGRSAEIIAAIGMAESGGDDQAVNPNDPNGGSFGVLQINGIHPGAKDTLGNPSLSFNMAEEISKSGTDFKPWSTYTSGRYLQFMPTESEILELLKKQVNPPQETHVLQTTQPTGSTMNPAANAATSGGTAGAFVALLAWGLSFKNVTLPADVAAAIQILLTSGIGYFLHIQTRSKQ